jgi:hypothetical protein
MSHNRINFTNNIYTTYIHIIYYTTESMSQYAQITTRDTTPENHHDTHTNTFTVQSAESYDIRNDDITEDFVISYDDTYSPRDTNNIQQQKQESFLQKINDDLSHLPLNTPPQLPQIPMRPFIQPPIAESAFSKRIKTDSALFYTNQLNSSKSNTKPSAGPPTNFTEILHSNTTPQDIHVPIPIDAQQTRIKLENAFIYSNSPLSSNTNSDTETSDAERNSENTKYFINEHVQNAFSKRKVQFKKISYEEIERSLSKYYDRHNRFSNEVDILITFMRGQKHLYNQACYVTQIKLYSLIIPALSITSIITVLTPFIQKYWWKIVFVMSGNAIATFLITTLKYMRFESACNTFTLIANHYEHYEHMLELTNNKLVFIQDETEQNRIILDKMREVEFKMSETKELCPIIIPVEVKNTYPVIFQTNIFTLIKKMDVHRKNLTLQLKNIKNEIRYIFFKWNSFTDTPGTHLNEESFQHISNNPQMQQEKIRMLYLMEQKEKIKKELIEYKDNYVQIDDLFTKEIKYAELNKNWIRWFLCDSKKIDYNTYTNPIIKEHLELILEQ